MTVQLPPPPPTLLAVVGRELATRRRRADVLFSLRVEPRMTAPIPAYHLSLDNAQRGDALTHAVFNGWRVPVMSAGAIGLAFARDSADGPVFQGLSHGDINERLLAAAGLANDIAGATADVFELRLLEIPALYITAVWLHGPSDKFIPLLEGSPPGSAPLAALDTIVPLIATRLEMRARARDLPSERMN